MSRMKTKELNELWHIIGFNMKNEMQSGKYPAISGLTQLEMGILQAIEMNPNNMLKNMSDLKKLKNISTIFFPPIVYYLSN